MCILSSSLSPQTLTKPEHKILNLCNRTNQVDISELEDIEDDAYYVKLIAVKNNIYSQIM